MQARLVSEFVDLCIVTGVYLVLNLSLLLFADRLKGYNFLKMGKKDDDIKDD